MPIKVQKLQTLIHDFPLLSTLWIINEFVKAFPKQEKTAVDTQGRRLRVL